MSFRDGPPWGASRIHGELFKLGYEVAQSTVSKYTARGGRPPSQGWKTFLRNHASRNGHRKPGRAAKDRSRASRIDPAHEHGKREAKPSDHPWSRKNGELDRANRLETASAQYFDDAGVLEAAEKARKKNRPLG